MPEEDYTGLKTELIRWRDDQKSAVEVTHNEWVRSLLMVEGQYYVAGNGEGSWYTVPDSLIPLEYRYVSNYYARLCEDASTTLLKLIPDLRYEVPGDIERGPYITEIMRHFRDNRWKLKGLLYQVYNSTTPVGLGWLKFHITRNVAGKEMVKTPVMGEDGKPVTDESGTVIYEDVERIKSNYQVELQCPDVFSVIPDQGARSWEQVRRLWHRPTMPILDIWSTYKYLLKQEGIKTFDEFLKGCRQEESPQVREYRDALAGTTQTSTALGGGWGTIDEFWMWPDDDWPNGRIVTMINDRVIQSVAWPVTPDSSIPGHGCPFIPFYWRKQALTVNGSGMSNRLAQPQRRMHGCWNKLWELEDIYSVFISMSNDARFGGQAVDAPRITGAQQGAIIKTGANHMEPRWIHPGLEKEILAQLNIIGMLRTDMRELAGVRKPSQATSGRDRLAIMQEDDDRLSSPATNLDWALEILGATAYRYVKETHTIQELARILDENHQATYVAMNRKKFMAPYVVVKAVSPEPSNPDLIAQREFAFASALEKCPEKYKHIVLKKLGKSREWELPDPDAADIKEIEKEHAEWLQGTVNPPSVYDNDQLHMEHHVPFIMENRERFSDEVMAKIAGQVDGVAEQLYGPSHFTLHLAQAAQKMQATMPQVGPTAGPGGPTPQVGEGGREGLTPGDKQAALGSMAAQ